MIKKFSELNESHGDTTRMIPVVKKPWGNKSGIVKSTIEININGYLEEGDDRTEIPYQEALNLIRQSLENLAGSNDGSEMLLNVNDDEIRFK